MERLNNDYLGSDDVLVAEHRHRYLWAAGYLRGDVLDLACGYGYGAEILERNCPVANYTGIDASQEAIENAQQHFARPGRRYLHASATDIPMPDASVDAIVSLETLEHLQEPADAVREFKRVLRPGGMLVGSVPSRYFDDLAERVYGANPYHVTRFDLDHLHAMLSAHFATVRVYFSALEIVTHIGILEKGVPAICEEARVVRERPAEHVSGSFHFVATDRPAALVDAMHGNRMYVCLGVTDHEERKVQPLRKLVADTEDLVKRKDQVIEHSAALVQERDGLIVQLQAEVQQLKAEAQKFRRQLEAMPRWVRRLVVALGFSHGK